MREILARFTKKDRWNFDESSLFAFAPPDRGLATRQMNGKKKSKFRITLGFACNADGSEKMPLVIIGKSRRPRCFKARSPAEHGFYYRNKKKAWMTREIFEEYAELHFTLTISLMKQQMGQNVRFEDASTELECLLDAQQLLRP